MAVWRKTKSSAARQHERSSPTQAATAERPGRGPGPPSHLPRYLQGPLQPVQRKCAACAAGGAPCPACANEDEWLQRKEESGSAGETPSGPVRAIASAGLEGAGEPLPHRERIQASFGDHDVGGIKARVGGAAAQANERLGSVGYTLGDRVGFRSAPDLRLAAHEAAHVIQQRGGVSLKNGIDTPGDEFERQADRVADAVVRGESAGTLLGPAGPGSRAASGVQRQPLASAAREPLGVGGERLALTAPVYARKFMNDILAAISQHLNSIRLPSPHPRLPWTDEKQAIAAIVEEIENYLKTDLGAGATRLYELTYPADLWDIIDEARDAKPQEHPTPRYSAVDIFHGPVTQEPARWEPQVGYGVATALDDAIVGSITRMGMRLRVQLDNPVRVVYSDPDKASLESAAENTLSTDDLVASRPMDTVMAQVFAHPDIVRSVKKDGKRRDDTPGKPFLQGLHTVSYEWQGSRDSTLWNWIRVSSPARATAEDVSYTLYGRSDQAFQILASPPYFRIPAETAMSFSDAARYAPKRKDPYVWEPLQPGVDLAGLTRSKIADDVAFEQAGAKAKPDPAAGHALERSQLQLGFLGKRLATWRLDAQLAGAVGFVERRIAEKDDPRAIERWSPVLVAQERTLYAVAAELGPILLNLEQEGIKPPEPEEPSFFVTIGWVAPPPPAPEPDDPITRAIKAYATAAGVSHLGSSASAALATARRLQAQLPLAIAEEKIRLAREAVGQQRGAQKEAGRVEEGGAKTMTSLPELAKRAAEVRAKVARGAMDPDVVAQLTADTEEIVLLSRLVTLDTQVHHLQQRITDVGLTDAKYEGGYITPYGQAETLRKQIGKWEAALDEAKNAALEAPAADAPPVLTDDEKRNRDRNAAWIRHTSRNAPPANQPVQQVKPPDVQQRIAKMRQRIAGIEAGMVDFCGEKQFDCNGLFKWAEEQIRDKQLSDLIWSIAIQLGVTILTGQVAGLIVSGVRGLALAREAVVAGELIGEARSASMLYSTFELVLNAGLGTLSQRAMGQGGGPRDFAENALGILLTNAAMRPFRGLLEGNEAAQAEKALGTWLERAKRTGKLVTHAALELGVGMAAGKIAHAATHFDELGVPGGEEWITQGIALVAGHFVHARTAAMHERIQKAATRTGSKYLLKLRERAQDFGKRLSPDKLETLSREGSLELLKERNRLLLEEARAYKTLGTHALEESTVVAKELAASAQISEAALRLAGLQPVVEGEIFEGTQEQIMRAVQATGGGAARFDEKTGVWSIEAGGKTIEIQDRTWQSRTEKRVTPAEEAIIERNKSESALKPPAMETELDIAQRYPRRPSTLAGYEEEIALPNGHVWRRTRGGGWCRFSNGGVCMIDRRRAEWRGISAAQRDELTDLSQRGHLSIEDLNTFALSRASDVSWSEMIGLLRRLPPEHATRLSEMLRDQNLPLNGNDLDYMMEQLKAGGPIGPLIEHLYDVRTTLRERTSLAGEDPAHPSAKGRARLEGFIRAAADLGAQGGEAWIAERGIALDAPLDPRAFSEPFGHGFDATGTDAAKRKAVLEWKGETAELSGGNPATNLPPQMTDEWVGWKLAEMEALGVDISEFMTALAEGKLIGYAIHTRTWRNGKTYTRALPGFDPIVYDVGRVTAAMDQRTQLLRRPRNLPTNAPDRTPDEIRQYLLNPRPPSGS